MKWFILGLTLYLTGCVASYGYIVNEERNKSPRFLVSPEEVALVSSWIWPIVVPLKLSDYAFRTDDSQKIVENENHP